MFWIFMPGEIHGLQIFSPIPLAVLTVHFVDCFFCSEEMF